MKIKNTSKSEAIIHEIGARLTKQRLETGLTQAALAEKAEVSKRTIERIESGASIQLSTLVQVLGVFGLLDLLDGAIPSSGRPVPPASSKTTTSKTLDSKSPDDPSVQKSRHWGYDV